MTKNEAKDFIIQKQSADRFVLLEKIQQVLYSDPEAVPASPKMKQFYSDLEVALEMFNDG